MTQGFGSGVVEVAYSIAQNDSSKPIAQYSLDRGRTWRNATLPDVSVNELTDRKNVTINWDVGSDIASYLQRIESIGRTIEMIQDPSVIPDLLLLSRQKSSPYREKRQQAVEAIRILEKKEPWVIEGVLHSMIHPDPAVRSGAVSIIKTVDTPEAATAIVDYEKYWNDFSRRERELVSFENEFEEQLYQDNLRKPIPFDIDEISNNFMRWWGISKTQADALIKDLDVLREQTELSRLFREGFITENEYWERLEQILTQARERRQLERRQQQQINQQEQ